VGQILRVRRNAFRRNGGSINRKSMRQCQAEVGFALKLLLRLRQAGLVVFKMSAMRNPCTMTIVAIALFTGTVAHGQAPLSRGAAGGQGTSGKTSAPAVGAGDRNLMPSTLPAIAPPEDALKNLAGRGYADPNYVSPAERSKNPTSHHVGRARPLYRVARYGSLYVPYRNCCCDYWRYY
jgi:hypothetical protein